MSSYSVTSVRGRQGKASLDVYMVVGRALLGPDKVPHFVDQPSLPALGLAGRGDILVQMGQTAGQPFLRRDIPSCLAWVEDPVWAEESDLGLERHGRRVSWIGGRSSVGVSARLCALYIHGSARHRGVSKKHWGSIRELIWDRLPFHGRRKGAPAVGDARHNMMWRSRSPHGGVVEGANDVLIRLLPIMAHRSRHSH